MRPNAPKPTIYLLLLCFFILGANSISNKVFYPISSNMGFKTDYYMSFTPDLAYSLPDLNLKLDIPLEFELSQISNDMECFMSASGATNSYIKMTSSECFVQPNTNTTFSLAGEIIINVGSLSSSNPLHFVFTNIVNPTTDSSSFFGLCIRSGTHLLECDKQFKMLTFTSVFTSYSNGFQISTSPLVPVVGQGTTYYLKLRTDIISLTSAYDLDQEFVEIRVVFPKEYSSTNAICSLMQLSSITGTYAAIQVTTTSTPSKSYSIECKRIQNLITSYLYTSSSPILKDLYLKIQNIENPIYSGSFTNQLYVQISRGGRNQIVERIAFPQTILIAPQSLEGEVHQTHLMRNATTQYFFYMTHDLNYAANSKIRLTIGNNSLWTIHDVKLMFGFTNNINFTSQIVNGFTESVVQISDYGLASKEVQQIIAMNLTSSSVIGDHVVKIETLIDNVVSGTWNGIVSLNATWGSFNRLSFSAVQQPTKLPVSQTGPLEFTLFLNYELPQSQNIESGSMIISFTPPIATPDPDIYGKVKCYFKATMQAALCDYDNSNPLKTMVTIVSPPYDEFQYSEIPIIITTEGGIDQNHLGLTISPIVERYKFEVEFYLYNSTSVPSEVLYTNWLADAIELPGSLTGKSLSWEANQITALHFNLVAPLMTTPEERLIFLFKSDSAGRNAWHSTLGYTADRIYKEFPCVVVNMPGLRIRCDLYTYVNTVGPYNKLHISSRLLGPFIMVYGFQNAIATGQNIQIYLPGIKLSGQVGAQAIVSFSILQETPGDTQPYIELYHQDINMFTTIPAPSITPSTPITITPQVQVQTLNLYSMTWPPVSNANVAFIKYDFTMSLPSIETKFGTCSGICYSTGYPNNWMVEIPALGAAGAVTSPHALTSTLSIEAMPHIANLVTPVPVKITTYSANGQTLETINMIHEYIPQPMTGTFNLLDVTSTIYSGLKQWYEVGFTTASSVTSTYPFIRLKLSSELQFTSPEQCESITVLAFNETGIKCKIVTGSNSHELIVSNIQYLSPGTPYRIKLRMQTTAADHTLSIAPLVDVFVNHNQTIVNSLVEEVRSVPLVQVQIPIMAKPDEFVIHNPQVLNEEVRVNYIGRLFIDFTSTVTMMAHFKITFPNHRYNTGKWSTANELSGIIDPLVCMLNGQRFYCSQTYNPLTITIQSAVINSGQNRLELDTEYVTPFNGLVFPTIAGNYEIHLSTINTITAVQTQQHSFYTYIHPPSLQDIEIASIVKDVDTQSVYLLNFTIADTVGIPPANHAVGLWSRIFVEFPTIVNGQRVFADNLGDYIGKLNERVGCAFLQGPQYALPEATKALECRLIPPEIPGAPVKVEIINFDAFSATLDSMALFIFKIKNPGTDAAPINSFEIKVKINMYASTGEVYPLFESDFVVFLDPRAKNPSPANVPSTQSELTNFFDMALDVGDTGKIQMKAETINAGAVLPFYMLVKLPTYLPVANEQLNPPSFVSCPASNFQYCVSAPQVNYVLVKTIMSPSFFEIRINDYPLGISQQDSMFYSMIIEEGRHVGNIEYIISEEKRWLDIRGDIIFNFIQPVGLIQKSVTYKERYHVAIQFQTTNYIPETGSIEISFPASVTKIYPYCRSAFSNGSLLQTKSGASGEVGCAVQNTNHWVITGFADVPPATTIMISGYIDLPTISGSLGLAEIITYSDNHQTDIYTNGSQIDYVNPYFNLMVDNVLAMNPNENIFLTQRDVVRAGDIADFRVLLKMTQSLTTLGTIKLDLSKNDFNGKPGGFQFISTEKKVCELIDIATEDRVGCQVTAEQDLTSAGESYVRFTMRVFEDLLTTTTYELRVTTQKYSYPTGPEGIRYPTVPSTYKIDIDIKYGSAATNTVQQLYLDVYGPQFTSLKVTQHNYIQNQYNLYWFELQPTVSITTGHQIVVEFPTKSNDGLTALFSNNLGLNEYKSGNEIAMDIFDTLIGGVAVGNDFMKCHIHHGSQVTGVPVRVVCGNFLAAITATDTLRFALGIVNPFLVSTQLSIPIMVYSQDPYIFTRTNFNLVNGAGYIYDTSNILSKSGYPKTTSMQMETPNDDFIIGDAHTYDLLPGDAFYIKFGFPIRVNGKVAGGCTDPTKAIIFGDAFYHERLRTVVCKIPLTGTMIPAQLTPVLNTPTLLFMGFYTPWYYLAVSEQKIYAVSHYYSTTSSEVVQYIDPFPIFAPRYTFSSVSQLTMLPVLAHTTTCQRNDYIFKVQLDPMGSADLNLQYTKLIGITFPLLPTVDWVLFGRDCVEHPTTGIEVKLCDINEIARTIYIEIVPGIYSNDKIIAIQTKGLAIRNPCLVPTTDLNTFVVNFFSWQNITASDQRANNRVYMTMDTRNMPSVPLTYVNEVSNAAASYFYPFEWVEIPNEKYYDEFHQFKDGQYSPFKFDLKLITGIAAQAVGSWNTLTLYYGTKFDVPSPEDQYIDDLKYNTEYCYLRNTRVQKCVNDYANKKITMYFQFDLPITEWINVYFSIQNPMNREINGFKYIGSDSDLSDGVSLELKEFGLGTSQIFKVNPFEAKQTNFDPALTQLPERAIINGIIDYGTSLTSQLNVIDITLTLNTSVTDIKGLKFEVPLVDEFGVPIFTNPGPAFMDLADGDEYPCGNNDPANSNSGKAKCYLFKGSNANLGQPTSIIMTDFKYTTQIKARFLINNPADIDKWVTILVKAYKGSSGPQNSLIGHKYIGYWRFHNFFKTVDAATGLTVAGPLPTSAAYLYPSNPALSGVDAIYATTNPLWMDSTTWVVTGAPLAGTAAATLEYVIFEAYVNNYDGGFTEPQICQVDWTTGNSMSDDMFYFRSRVTGSRYQKVYFIKKWAGAAWSLQYFKCKHYLSNIKVYYHGSKLLQAVSTYTIPSASFVYNTYAASTIRYFEIMNSKMEIEIDVSGALADAILNRGFNWEDEVNYAMVITTDNVYPFTGMTACHAVGGFENLQGETITCLPSGTNSFIISGFNKLLTNYQGQYAIRVDAVTNVGLITYTSSAATVYIYAGPDAYTNSQHMFHVTSLVYTRKMEVWPAISPPGASSSDVADWMDIDVDIPPEWTLAEMTNYSNYYTSPLLDVSVQNVFMTTTTLSLQVKVQANSPILIEYSTHYYYIFRFYLEGLNVNCGSIVSMTAQSNYGGAPSTFTPGFICGGHNYFFYSSYYHSLNTGRVHRTFSNSLSSLGSTFDAGEYIIFNIDMNVPTTDPSWTRDWVGVKVFLQTTYLDWYGCCNLWYRYRKYDAYGEGFHSQVQLFTSGVTLNALSDLTNEETELEVIMRNAYVPINPSTTDKNLLLEFSSGATVLFPYVNTTTGVYNYLIECNCLVSGQPDFSGATTYTSLDCYLKLPQGSYANTAISINLNVPLNNYVKCYFPGFNLATPMSISVTTKLTNKGINQATYPTAGTSYGSIYSTTSNSKAFAAGAIPNTPAPPTVTETPDLYAGATPFTIKSLYSTLGTYTLTIDMNPTILATPIFYINFQKGGPISDSSLCTTTPGAYEYCRVYSKYRNILVAKYVSNVGAGVFTSSTLSVPTTKEPNTGSDYNLMVYVKQPTDTQYIFSSIFTRADPSLLIPSTTILNVYPDRMTSTNYETYTSNIILSFKLQGHRLESFWSAQSKLQISYDQPSYFSANKGCIVSTDVINDDAMFSFHCRVDTANQMIVVQNRYFNTNFSAGGLIQIVVGVVNQPASVPIEFHLRLYKWWVSTTKYGLLLEKKVTYTPFSVATTQSLQLRDQVKQYPFYTRVYSDVHAPFRMAFKMPATVTVPLSYINDLTTFMILDDFDGVATFAATQLFQCHINEFTSSPTNTQAPHPNGYRNYKQNTQYYTIPTYCTYLNTTALRIEIPRVRDLDATKYYELVVMPVANTMTGFPNVYDSLAKLSIFPPTTAGHNFDIKLWTKNAFNLNSLWIVTTRPLEPNAIQFTFSSTFAAANDFPNHYIEIIFNNLDLNAVVAPYNQVGQTVPCSLSSTFVVSVIGTQKPNCVVTYADKLHEVIKIRVENFKVTAAATFKLSFDDFILPSVTGLLQQSNTFSVCMAYWSAAAQHEKCFGEILVIDGYTNILARTDLTSASFLSLAETRYGASSSPTIQLSYPVTTTALRNEKLLIRITGGYSAVNPAPLSFTGSTYLWHNPMANLYIQRLSNVAATTTHQIAISGVRNPYPYEMEEYMLGNTVALTYFTGYHPHTKYTMSQPAYSGFTKNSPLVRLTTTYFDDVKVNARANGEVLLKLNVEILQTYANLILHENDRFEIQFVTNVVRVKRCWAVTTTANIEYSKISTCTAKPSDPKRLQLLNFFKARTDHNLIVYVIVQAASSSLTVKSHLYATNDQQQFESTVAGGVTISSISLTMPAFTDLSFTESHYMPGYYEQIVTPVTHTSSVEFMYIALYLPEKLFVINSIFTVLLNSTLTIQPANFATNTRLICEWMKVSKYGRQYETGKFSHCVYTSPNIVINAPTWHLDDVDGSSNRIPYLLKIRQESPTATTFTYPTTSQVQEIILQSDTGGIYKKDTLRIHPYQHFNGLTTKHTTLSINQLNTYTVTFATPSTPVGAGTEYVLSLEIDSKYMVDVLGVKDIHDLYGEDDKNSSIVDNLLHNMVYTSLPHKWINGIPYSCWTDRGTPAEQTTIAKSQKTIRINLLLETYTAGMVWKIPLLKNPATEKPFRMNLTLWSYPAAATQGHKELFYEVINEHVTKTSAAPAAVAYDIEATAQTTNIIQTTTNSLSVQFPVFTPTMSDVIQLKILARAVGLTTIPSFWSPAFADASYNLYFFKNINFLIGEKNVNDGSRIMNFGAVEVSNQYSDQYGYEWLKVHSASTTQTVKLGSQLKKNMPACSIPAITYTRMSGKDDLQNGKFEAQFTFTTPCNIPINSTLKLVASTTDLQFLPMVDEAYCETSFRSRDCWLDGSKILYVRIDDLIPLGTALTVTTFAKSKTRATIKPIYGQVYAIPDKPSTLVNTIASTLVLPITTASVLDNGAVFPLIIKPLYERTTDPLKPNFYTKLTGTFTTGHLPFTYMNLLSPFGKLMTSNETFFYRANTTGSPYTTTQPTFNLNWMRTQSTPTTNFDFTQLILPNGLNSYAIQTPTQYTFTIGSMYETTDLNNFLIGPVGSYYQFEYRTDKEIAYHEVYPLPIAQPVTVINPLTQVGEETVLGVEFVCSRQAILPGDKVEIQLDSHNLIESMYTFTDEAVQCIEFVGGVLTSNPELVCEVAQYPDSTTKKPMILHVYPTNTVALGTPVKIWVSPVINSPNVLVAGVTVRVLRPCSGEKLCTMHEGRGWYKTTNSMTVTDYHATVATFATSSTIVLDELQTHTYTFTAINLATTFIKYPQNYQDVMPVTCTSGSICLIFPKQRKVVTVEAGTSTTTLAVNGMTNGIYIQPDDSIDLKLASLTNLDKYQIIHPVLDQRTSMPLLGGALNTFTITNTQNSGNVFLRNYWNTVKMEIDGLFSSKFVKAFYIVAATEVTDWETQYCNATIQSPAHLPYPTRLQCKQITATTIQIIIPEGVDYVAGVSQTQTLTVHAKFWFQDFPIGMDVLYVSPAIMSSNFNAYGSFKANSFASKYYITQASTPELISQHKTPLISDVAFNTESFEERLASVNDQTTFDILIDPITSSPVDYIELVIPQEFKYPNVLMHDMCQLIYRRTVDLPSCQQTRRDNQTIITIDIDQTTYDNGPRILQIASRNTSNWFTAPSLPGSLYNMTISLYGTSGQLLQKQTTKNSSRIKGYNLYLPSIVVENGRDELEQQIYDITFVVGPVGVKQGYKGILALAEYYSEIKVKFETVEGYEYLLGGFYKHGDRVGCVTNLKSIKKEISCIFSQGTNITHEPSIIISNYEQIIPGTTVKLSFANIKNLPQNVPTTLRNTLAVQVKYHKVGDDTVDHKYSFNMYQPTQAITDATSPISYTAPGSLVISYPGQTIVNEPTILQIDLKPTLAIAVTDYIVVKFPKNGLRDEYSRFNVQCANCAKVEIFYRAQVIRIYPLAVHPANTLISYILTGFPSTEYIVDDPAYAIVLQVYNSLKMVNRQQVTVDLNMQGCKLNSGIISSTSPYIGDTGVTYTFEAQVNVSQLSRSDEPKQLNMMIKLPTGSAWFSSQSSCEVESPLYCSIDLIQKRLVVKNLLSYTKSTISIKTVNVINPSALTTLTTLNFSSSLFEETTVGTVVQENTICLGAFAFTYMPSPPNQCTMSLKSQHSSTLKENIFTFGIVCQQAIRNSTTLYMMLPRESTFNNPTSSLYKCWANTPSMLLDNSCQIVFMNGSFYMKTVGQLNIDSNLLGLELSLVMNSPLIAGSYVFGSALDHAGNFYSVTNNVTLTFYQTPVQPQLNSSISIQVLPKQASAEAIYIVRVPTQVLSDKLSLNFGSFGLQLDPSTKITYYQPIVNSTTSSSDTTNWVDQQTYFSLLQQTYTNSLGFGLGQMADLSQDILVDTSSVPKSTDGWTYIILSPITNPSTSSATDSLQMKILDTITTNTSTYDTLINQLSISLNLNIENPPSNIYQTQYSVSDNDVLSSTEHTVTFKLDRQVFANQNGVQNIQFIVDPPTSSLAYINTVETCLYYPSSSALPVECKQTTIGVQELSFKPTSTNLTFLPQTPFKLVFKNITNPENETFCDAKIATEKDYLASYFNLKMFVDQKLSYQSVFVGMLDDSIKPCVEFKTKKGDILHNLPSVINAGFETPFNISITQATANLRVFLSTNDTDLVFSQSIIYFNTYGVMSISLKAIVSSNAVNKTVEVYLRREQTSAFNSFREPQSFLVQIVAGKKETVSLNEMQSSSVGYDIKIPIILSKPSVNNMTLLLTIQNSTALQSYKRFLTFSTLQVPIPALSQTSFFTVRYNGTTIPPTFSISLKLISQNNPTHELLKDVVYLYFSIDPKYQTLPPIMKMNLLWLYKSNKDLQSKTIFYCCANNSTTLKNNLTMLLPVIIETKTNLITATRAQIQVSTRSQATLFYQLREKGKHFELQNITSQNLRLHALSQSVQTVRNSTKIVNANQMLNFTNLEHETDYFLYVSAFDAFGDSEIVTIVKIKTSALSRAIKFNLNCYQIETNEVMIVRALADILKIDMRRIKVVTSQKNLAQTYSLSQENKPIYAHEIVISPSLTDDSMSPEDLFKNMLMKNTQNQAFLKEKIPSWTGAFDPVSQYQQKKSYYELNRIKPSFKEAPTAQRISYYNATINVKLWAKARISAVILVEERQTPDSTIEFVNTKPKGRKISSMNGTQRQLSPNSKQIVKGLNQFNQKLVPKYTFTGLTNDQGEGAVFFKGLKPGSYCKVYITATNPENYEPLTSLADAEVYMIDFNLLWNPNLKGNDHLALNQLKKKNPKMYEVIKEFYDNQDNSNKKNSKTTLKKM